MVKEKKCPYQPGEINVEVCATLTAHGNKACRTCQKIPTISVKTAGQKNTPLFR